MPKKFRDRILFRGNKAQAIRALPVTKKLFDVARVRSAGSRYFSEWFRDVFPGVHVRIEINGRYRTALIWAEGKARFIATFSETGVALNERHMHYLFYDPRSNSFSGIAELFQSDHSWMDISSDVAEWAYWTPKPEATLYPVIGNIVGQEMPTASFQKNDDGDYALVNSAGAEDLAAPYALGIPYPDDASFGDDTLHVLPMRWRDKDGTQWGQADVARLVTNPSPPPTRLYQYEKHLVKRVPPAIVWTSEHVLSNYLDSVPDKDREVFGSLTGRGNAEGNSTKMYSYSMRDGELEDPSYNQETIQRIYEYDREAGTQTEVIKWTFPDNFAALAAYVGLGAAAEFHYLEQFLEDPHDKWCGYTLFMHNGLGGYNADIHFYLAPLEDKIDQDDVTWSAGMANAQLAFTVDAEVAATTETTAPANQSFQPVKFWHIGGNKFGFIIQEKVRNTSGQTWPYLIGVYNWNNDTWEIVYESALGKNVSNPRHIGKWLTCGDFTRQTGGDSKGVTYNVLGKKDPTYIEQVEWNDGSAKDVNGNELTIATGWGISLYEAYEN
jgi:hypothetical protein